MKCFLFLFIISLSKTCFSQINLDSLDRANSLMVRKSGADLNKPTIEKDSIIWLSSNIRKDHRFFGYEKPDILSKRLILFSVFTDDVEGNPFNLKYGAYYETSNLRPKELKYISTVGSFIKIQLISSGELNENHYIFFERKWFKLK